eukprot:298813-Amphidinium_carterae.2
MLRVHAAIDSERHPEEVLFSRRAVMLQGILQSTFMLSNCNADAGLRLNRCRQDMRSKTLQEDLQYLIRSNQL